MNFSRWSIYNPIPSIMLFIVLSIFGLYSFSALKVQTMPDVDLGIVTVMVKYPGASPSSMETQVLNKLENTLSGVQGVKHLHGTAVEGVASVILEFRLEKNMTDAIEEVRSAIASVRADLPTEIEEPVVRKMELGTISLLAYSISSNVKNTEELSWFIDDVVIRRVAAIKGVGKASRVGGVERQIQVELDPLKMQALGVTATVVSRQLRRVHGDNVAGSMELSASSQLLRVISTVKSIDDIGQIRIPLPDGRSVQLAEIGVVYDTIADSNKGVFLNGNPVLGLEVFQAKGANQVEIQKGMKSTLAQLLLEYPDLTIENTLDFAEIAQDEFDSSMRLLYEGGLLTIVIVFLFLRSIRATIIAAIALPLSLIPTFAGMYYLGFSINVITLIALSLVIGILVDDAIVEIENIERHSLMGKTPFQAAMEAADEIGLAVIATTLTLVAVFLPTAFMGGTIGLFFKQFGITASLAVFTSLLVARMLTPMLCAYLLKPTKSQHKEAMWLTKYMQISHWCIQHRFKTMMMGLLFFILSLAIIPWLPTGFLPSDNSTYTQVSLKLPPGAQYQEMEELTKKVEKRLSPNTHIKKIYTTIGDGSAGSDPFDMNRKSASSAIMTLTLVERSLRPSKNQIQQEIAAVLTDLPGVQISVGLGTSNDKYKLALVGTDSEELAITTQKLEKELRSLPNIGSISSDNSLERMEVVATIDFDRAADLGVNSHDIAETLRISTIGDAEMYLPKYDLGKRQIPILVRLNQSARNDLAIIENLYVYGSKGLVRLGEVAKLSLAGGPVKISHYDRYLSSTYTVMLGKYQMGELEELIHSLPSMQNLPATVKIVPVGDAEVMGELFFNFNLAILAGILSIYILLVLFFKSFLQPFTLLVALPLSLGGSFMALLITQNSFSMPSLIGLLMLMGIATKNSILLVEYVIVAYRDRGMSRMEAVLDACHKRARPIIMTSLAMMAGMLPVAFSFGGSDMTFRSPMAITVIGGLITSTMLSLIIVPALFTYMDDFEIWCKSKLKHIFSK